MAEREIMEVVTLAIITLNRIGSASSGGFTQHREVRRLQEVADEQAETLRAAIIQIAVELGENELALRSLADQGVQYDGSSRPARIFNVQGPNTSYSEPYASCRTFPALKAETRYFELAEVSA